MTDLACPRCGCRSFLLHETDYPLYYLECCACCERIAVQVSGVVSPVRTRPTEPPADPPTDPPPGSSNEPTS